MVFINRTMDVFYHAITDSATAIPTGQNRLLALNYVYPGEDPMVCAAHSAWGVTFQSRFSQLPPRLPMASDRWEYSYAISPKPYAVLLCFAVLLMCSLSARTAPEGVTISQD